MLIKGGAPTVRLAGLMGISPVTDESLSVLSLFDRGSGDMVDLDRI